MIANLTLLDLTGPTNKKRDPQSTFVEVTFLATKLDARFWINVGSKESTWMLFVNKAILSAVVTGKEDDGVLIERKFLQ